MKSDVYGPMQIYVKVLRSSCSTMEQVIELLEKREEYFDGLTYYAGMDRLKICKDVERGIREYLRGRKALSKEMEQYQLRQ